MSGRGAWLLRLYPRRWRERYGAELEALLEQERLGPGLLINVICAASVERLFNLSGLGGISMETYPASVLTAIRRPSGFVPLAMSGMALALVLYFLVTVGTQSPDGAHDEGAPAHMFQLLIAGQLPFFAYVAFRWLQRDWRVAMTLLGIQAVAIVAAAAIPFTLNW